MYIHTHNGIVFNLQKEGNSAIYSIDEPGAH